MTIGATSSYSFLYQIPFEDYFYDGNALEFVMVSPAGQIVELRQCNKKKMALVFYLHLCKRQSNPFVLILNRSIECCSADEISFIFRLFGFETRETSTRKRQVFIKRPNKLDRDEFKASMVSEYQLIHFYD